MRLVCDVATLVEQRRPRRSWTVYALAAPAAAGLILIQSLKGNAGAL